MTTARQELFNGHDLTGWQHVGAGRFVVENGLLRTEGGMGLLWHTGGRVGDACLHVVYRVATAEDNSGVFIRIPEPPADPWAAVHTGYEVQIHEAGESARYRTGALYSFAPATARAGRIGGWNEMDIALDGSETRVTLNGMLVCTHREGDPVPPRGKGSDPERGPRPRLGYIGLQNHARGDTVYFREVSVRSSD